LKEFLKRAPIHLPASKETPRDIPDNMWVKCEKCSSLLYVREYEKNLKVCQKCGHHARLSAHERIAMLFDEGSFEEIGADLEACDPLEFVSLEEAYSAKVKSVQRKTGLKEAMIAGTGTVDSLPLSIAVMDFSFMGASMGSVVGEKIARAVESAIAGRRAVLTISSSGGARMHEGILSLMQMAKTTAAMVRLAEAQLPHFSLLVDPCSGGVSASYATSADVIMAEPGAFVGFAGPRVIEQVTKQKLPAGVQTAEFVLEHGMIDMIVPRREFKSTLLTLMHLYTNSDPEFYGGIS
jgi:acetyl-CoA carboxylase carboxyl transferase subunit beta